MQPLYIYIYYINIRVTCLLPLLVPDAQVLKKCSVKATCWMKLPNRFFKVCMQQGKKWPGHFLSPLFL